KALKKAAEKHGLSLLGVPSSTRFRSLGEFVVNFTKDKEFVVFQNTLSAHIELVEVLTSNLGIDGLLGKLRRLNLTEVAVIDHLGKVLGKSPYSSEWHHHEFFHLFNQVASGEAVSDINIY